MGMELRSLCFSVTGLCLFSEFPFLFVVCRYMCVHMCAGEHICPWLRRPEVKLGCHPQVPPVLLCLMDLELIHSTSMAGQEAPGTRCLCLPRGEATNRDTHLAFYARTAQPALTEPSLRPHPLSSQAEDALILSSGCMKAPSRKQSSAGAISSEATYSWLLALFSPQQPAVALSPCLALASTRSWSRGLLLPCSPPHTHGETP